MTIPAKVRSQLQPAYLDCVDHLDQIISENAALYVADIMIHKNTQRSLTESERHSVRRQIRDFYCFADSRLQAI